MYLRGTSTHALCFGGSDIVLQGYVDSDMAGDKYSRRSTPRYVFTIGGTTVNWISKLQNVVSLSTTEAKFLQRFMEELGKRRRIVGCIVTVRVSFILQRTQPSIRRLRIYILGIISYDLPWKMDI
jgi:hypothetical protein